VSPGCVAEQPYDLPLAVDTVRDRGGRMGYVDRLKGEWVSMAGDGQANHHQCGDRNNSERESHSPSPFLVLPH